MKQNSYSLSNLPLATLLFLVGCADERIERIVNQPPEAVLSGGGEGFFVGNLVPFDGGDSFDEDGKLETYAWDFGDELSSEGKTIEHIFNDAGTFTVTLTVTDDDGAEDSADMEITIGGNEPPTPVIDAPDSGVVGIPVHFNATDSEDPDGTIAAYLWDFGNNDTGTSPLWDFTFETEGTFVVELTVTDNRGASATLEHEIVISESPQGFSGEWSWFLTDESLRDNDCGHFEDSQLTILVNGTNISITEHAQGTTVPYSGTLTGMNFDVINSGAFGIDQRIRGTFTSNITFESIYNVDGTDLGLECPDLPLEGTKNPD